MMMSRSLLPNRLSSDGTPRKRALPLRAFVTAIVLCFVGSGCAAISNPVGEGIPARRVPQEYLAPPKEDLRTIPLTTLGQIKPANHVLAADDIVGVYIEGIWGEKGQPIPVRYPEQGNLPPAVGFPIPVSSDGTLPLPYIDPLKVAGLTLKEAEDAIRKAYTVDKKILVAGKERILISLIKARSFRVQVVRQDTPQVNVGNLQNNARRGTGATIDLPIYENDVLNALNRTGGLPGLDALNEIIVQRNIRDGSGTKVVRIPLRITQGSSLPFQPNDVVLENNDVVFLEARDTEVYYMGGLTIPRQFPLPRDYDIRVTEAVALAGGPLVNGGVNNNNLQGNVIAAGLGSPSPSSVAIVRRLKHGGQIKIMVNLNRALNDTRENPIVQTGDMLILQETIGEAMTRYFTNQFRFIGLNRILNTPDATIDNTFNLP